MSEEMADSQLEVYIQWGRYAEFFGYDPPKQRLYLEEGA
jgi:hypothetical protein